MWFYCIICCVIDYLLKGDYIYQELLELDFGSWFDSKYKDERIVLFEDFAKDFLSKQLSFAIELKHEGIEK